MKESKNRKKSFKVNKKVCAIIGVAVVVILLVVGICLFVKGRVTASSPKGMAEEYLEKYVKLDDSIVSNITYEFNDKLTAEQEQFYTSVIKRQYEKLSYSVSDCVEEEKEANVTVMITVTDLKSAYDQADAYVESHRNKYEDKDGNFDTTKAVNYKLDQVEKASETISYSINIQFFKDDLGKWVMQNLSDADLKKLSGTF